MVNRRYNNCASKSNANAEEVTQTTVELPHKVRTFVSANQYTDSEDKLRPTWGFGLTQESDTAMGYMSVGGNITYYNADTKDYVKHEGNEAYGRQSDLSFSSYIKVRMPSSYRFVSLYGLAGI